MNKDDKQILIESMRNQRNPNPVIPDYALKMLEDTCERTGLDWKLRHVYLIERGGKWQVTTSIDGFRLVANADAEYAGQEGPLWTTGPDQPWTDIPPAKEPYAAKIGVVRNKGGVCVTTYGVAKFSDYNAGSPMWKKMGPTMIAKCAEALALRKALPGKLGGLYTIEEMEQAEPKAKAERNRKEPEVRKLDVVKSEEEVKTEALILEQTVVKELQAIGAGISKNGDLDSDAKLRLSVVYNTHKAKLVEAEKAANA